MRYHPPLRIEVEDHLSSERETYGTAGLDFEDDEGEKFGRV
jgi:hypothetical protein